MPKLVEQDPNPIIVASVGGSIFRPSRVNLEFTRGFIDFCKEKLDQGYSIIAIVGGGGIARDAIEDAKSLGVSHSKALDSIGISVTRDNAFLLEKILQAHDLNVHIYKSGDVIVPKSVFVRGGTEPGHTTDLVTIQAAIDAGVSRILNIGMIPGLHPINEAGFDKSSVIADLSWNQYLEMFPQEHKPGVNIPFDTKAAMLAKEHNITVVLIGAEFDNINKYLSAQEFVGTVIHP